MPSRKQGRSLDSGTPEDAYFRSFLDRYMIGPKLHALRVARRLTLRQLARKAGLSAASLSKLETETLVPSLHTLASLCRLYGIGLGIFFSEPDRHRIAVTRKAELAFGKKNPSQAVRTISLNPPLDSPLMTSHLIEISSVPCLLEPAADILCGFLQVMAGEVELRSSGVRENLRAGDCVYLETQTAASLKAKRRKRATILVIRPAERLVNQTPWPPATSGSTGTTPA